MFRIVAVANVAFLASALTFKEEQHHSRADLALQILLTDANSDLSRDIHRGFTAQQNERGYEQSLGSSAMTAFIQRWLDNNGLEVLDPDALQGFVMYYDGSCSKKAFTDIGEELNDGFRPECHGSWIRPASSYSTEKDRQVRANQYDAMRQREIILHRSAAYRAARRMDTSGSSAPKWLQSFAREYVAQLQGKILDDWRFNAFVNTFASSLASRQISEDDLEPIENLTAALYEAANSRHPVVRLPVLRSSQVQVKEEDETPSRAPEIGIGATAPLNEAGYVSVAETRDIPEMAKFINRTAEAIGLKVEQELNLNAFAKWYNHMCAFQSFTALEVELQSSVSRPPACGGNWLTESGPTSPIVQRLLKRKMRAHQKHSLQ